MGLDNDLNESPALPDLSDSQNNVDVKLTEKSNKRKRSNSENDTVEGKVNGCGTTENTFSSQTSTSASDMSNVVLSDVNTCGTPVNNYLSKTSTSDMPLEHPQCVSTDEVMSQSCVDVDICLGENEDKERNMLTRAAEKGNGECDTDILDRGCNCNSVVADAELFAKDSVLEVVQMNIEQSINDNSSNPKGTSGSVKNDGLVKDHDEDLEVHDLSDKSRCIKTYSSKNLNNGSCKKNRNCPNSVNSNKEPTVQDYHNDDSHKISDGPLTDGFTEREKEHSMVQNNVEAKEVELIAENTSEQRSMTTSSAVDIPVTQLDEANARQANHGGGVARTIITNSKNKLLILDVNGLLADCISDVPTGYYQREPDFWVRRRKVYKRPFCDEFLQFCFDRFHVGVWSSRAKYNVDEVIKFLMGDSASRLLFCWNQSHCTTTKFTTVENKDKPLVLKELRKLWEKLEPGLPWEKGEFHESNTLLLDDSPYKALMNPKHTAIFPLTYRHYYTKDSTLGPKGDLRAYLEKLAMADNVQEFVSSNPFGQRPIREQNPSWGYYLKVIESVKCRENDTPSSAPDREQTD